MERREYLARSASALGVAAFAGCLEDVGVGTDESEADELEPDASPTERRVDRELRRAVGQANRAAISLLGADDDLADDGTADFDADAASGHVASARDHLETAIADAAADQRDDAEELEAFVDVLERVIDALDALSERDPEDAIDQVEEAMEARQFEDARESIRDPELDRTRDRLDPALETLEALDRDRLASRDVVDLEPIEDGATTVAAVLDAYAALRDGFDATVTGYERLDAGERHVDDGKFEPARAEFEAAEDAFEDATGTFEAGREDAPDATSGHFDTPLCRSEGLEDAASAFAESAAAAAQGDVSTARKRESEAENRLAEAERCGD